MKKALSIIVTIILVCTFVACNVNNSIETDVIDNKADLSVDSILKFFNEDYNAQEYTSDMISNILTNLENNGIALKGNVTTLIHLTKKDSAPELPDWSWAYVYEFTEETDAIAFEEDRRTFVKATEENGVCVRYDLIVVFGSAPIISSMEN